MFSLERTAGPRRVGLVSLVGLVLLPLVVAAGFLWATWDSTDRLDRVQAAVVNLDEPVKLGDQTVPLGRQLAGGLVTGGSGTDETTTTAAQPQTNFDWVLTDAADASAGLEAGTYAAVVTIPKTFSARATSFSTTDAAKIRPATLEVQTSEVSGITDPVVGQAITAAATKALNTTLTQQYLDGIYVGFNDLGKQFATVADASDELADGTEQLATGLDGVDTGATGLAEGLTQLDDGAQQLATGASGLSSGTTQLASGLDKLADGATALPGSTRTLANGTAASADGAGKLADGARKLAGGASQVSDGAAQLAGGVTALRNGTKAQPGGTKAFAAGAGQYAAGVKTYRDTFTGITALSDAALVRQFPQLCPAPATVAQCGPVLQGFRGGITATLAGFEDTKNPQTGATVPGLLPSAQQLATGARGIDGGVSQLATGASGVAGGATSLATGASGLSGGATSLAGGLDKLADGTDQLADGLKPLATGIRSTADGAADLAGGAQQLSTGAAGIATGTSQSASGAGELASGVTKLADAGHQLSDGSRKLSDGLAKGADAVPSYDKTTREKLSDVVTAPVQTATPTSVFSNVTTSSFLAVLALWVGALASYLVLGAVTARVLSSMKPSWQLALEGLVPGVVIGAVQAVALTVVLQLLLDLSAAQVVQLGAFALLTAVTFAALNHALVAWFGGVGRFVSVVVVVIGAAGALTAAVPATFDAVGPFLPFTPALDGVQALASGGTGAGPAASLLVAWLVLGLVAGVLAVARRRVVAPLVVPVPAT